MWSMSIFYTHLGDRAVLRINGADRVDFLQNLITQDVSKCGHDDAMMAALLTPQGKLLHDFLLLGEEDAFLIDCDAGQADALMKKLSLYKLRADVTLEKTDLAVHALWQEDGFPCPPASAFIEDPRHAGLGLRAVMAHYETGLPQRPLADWHANRIRLGIAQGPHDMPPGTVFPLEYGFGVMQAIDFKKGCFIGQEVTSRTHRKGALRKKLHAVSFTGTAPAPHSDITAGERIVGEIVAVDGAQGLALIREDALHLDLQADASGVQPTGGLFAETA
jgi:folate-binding protein YgfZ